MELKFRAWRWALVGGLLMLFALAVTALAPATAAPPPGPGVPATVVPSPTPNPCLTCPTPTATPRPCVICDLNDPFYRYWQCVVCQPGIIYPDPPECRSYNNITRGQIAKIVVVGANMPLLYPPTPTFADVPPSYLFYPFIEALAANNIVSGYPCGGPGEPCDPQNRPYFRPNNTTTRSQVTKMVVNAANIQDPIPSTRQTFADIPPNSPVWLWIERLAGRGAISGYACGGVGEPCDPLNRPYFRPNNLLTRGQAVKIVAIIFYPNCVSQTPAP